MESNVKNTEQEKQPGSGDVIKLVGSMTIRNVKPDGTIEEQTVNNLVVQTGKNWLAGLLAGESLNQMTHVGIGTSAAATSAGQTGLQGSQLARVAAASRVRTANAVTFAAVFPAGTGTGTINEAGVFDGSSGTTMFSRVVFAAPVVKSAEDETQISYTVTLG